MDHRDFIFIPNPGSLKSEEDKLFDPDPTHIALRLVTDPYKEQNDIWLKVRLTFQRGSMCSIDPLGRIRSSQYMVPSLISQDDVHLQELGRSGVMPTVKL